MQPGLISTAMTPLRMTRMGEEDMLAPDVTTYNPAQHQIDPRATVAGQLQTLTASESPLMTQARTGAMQAANQRGLLNTSMAAGAGEVAALGAMLPVAQQDAEHFWRTGEADRQARNEALRYSAEAGNMLGRAAFGGELDRRLQQVRGDQARELAGIEASYRTLIQASDSASRLYQQSVDALNRTLVSDLDPAAKDAAVARQTEMLRSGLAVLGRINALDLTSILNFSRVNR